MSLFTLALTNLHDHALASTLSPRGVGRVRQLTGKRA
jgi:hypothetical protein